jgi:hypothetical protein
LADDLLLNEGDQDVAAAEKQGAHFQEEECQAHQAVATPDGRRAWVVNVAANDLLEVNIAGGTFAAGRRFSSGGIRPITLVCLTSGVANMSDRRRTDNGQHNTA